MRAVTRPTAQAFQRDLDVARAQFDGVVQIFEFAFVPDLDRALVAGFFLPDAHPFGVVTIGAKGRGAAGADPFVAPLMAAFLFLEPFFQGFHQLVKTAQSLDFGFLFFAQVFFRHGAQPVGGDVHGLHHLIHADLVQPFESGGKGAVEFIEVAFIFDHHGAGEVIEPFDIIGGQPGFHPLEKGQVFAQRHGHAFAAQIVKEGEEHGAPP